MGRFEAVLGEIDGAAWETALEERVAAPHLGRPSLVDFDPRLHPRDRIGRFRALLAKLERQPHGSRVSLPHGVSVRRGVRGLEVEGGDEGPHRFGAPVAAAAEALFRHDHQEIARGASPEIHREHLEDELETAKKATPHIGDTEKLEARRAALRREASAPVSKPAVRGRSKATLAAFRAARAGTTHEQRVEHIAGAHEAVKRVRRGAPKTAAQLDAEAGGRRGRRRGAIADAERVLQGSAAEHHRSALFRLRRGDHQGALRALEGHDDPKSRAAAKRLRSSPLAGERRLAAALVEVEEASWRALLHPRAPKGRRGGGRFVDVLGKLEGPKPRGRGGRRMPPVPSRRDVWDEAERAVPEVDYWKLEDTDYGEKRELPLPDKLRAMGVKRIVLERGDPQTEQETGYPWNYVTTHFADGSTDEQQYEQWHDLQHVYRNAYVEAAGKARPGRRTPATGLHLEPGVWRVQVYGGDVGGMDLDYEASSEAEALALARRYHSPGARPTEIYDDQDNLVHEYEPAAGRRTPWITAQMRKELAVGGKPMPWPSTKAGRKTPAIPGPLDKVVTINTYSNGGWTPDLEVGLDKDGKPVAWNVDDPEFLTPWKAEGAQAAYERGEAMVARADAMRYVSELHRPRGRAGRATPAVATKPGMTLEQVRAKLKPGEKKVMGDLPDGTVIETPDGRVGILKPSEGKPTYGDKIYVVAYDVATGEQFEPPAVFPPVKSSSDPAVKKAAAALLDQVEPAPQQQEDLGGGQLAQLLQQLGQAAAPAAPAPAGAKPAGGAGLPGDLSVAHPAEMEARVQAVTGILQSGKAKENAVLDLIGPDPAREARIEALTSGDLGRALKEYRYTPVGDLAVLSGIEVRTTPIQGQAVCYMNDRRVAMGSTSAIGDFRHELGHAIRASLGGDGGPGKKTALSSYIAERHDETLAKAAEGAAKLKAGELAPPEAPPTAEGNALKQAFWEENFGTIDPRSLDNWEEDFAEQYRAYQKAVYQAYITKGGAPDHDAGALEHYRKTFPKWADFWDAWYTAQAEAAA